MTRKPRANRESVADKALTFRMTAEELRALSLIVDHHNQKLQSLGMAPVATQGSVCRSLIFREAVKLGFLSQVEPPSEPASTGNEDPSSVPGLIPDTVATASPSEEDKSIRSGNLDVESKPKVARESRYEKAIRNCEAKTEPSKERQ
jgi:hypothetical protein